MSTSNERSTQLYNAGSRLEELLDGFHNAYGEYPSMPVLNKLRTMIPDYMIPKDLMIELLSTPGSGNSAYSFQIVDGKVMHPRKPGVTDGSRLTHKTLYEWEQMGERFSTEPPSNPAKPPHYDYPDCSSCGNITYRIEKSSSAIPQAEPDGLLPIKFTGGYGYFFDDYAVPTDNAVLCKDCATEFVNNNEWARNTLQPNHHL